MDILANIKSLKKLSKKFIDKIDEIEGLINTGNIISANKEIFSLEIMSEKIVNSARILPSAIFFSDEDSEKLDTQIVNNLNFDISYLENGGFYIKMFSLLPKKNGGNASYVRASLSLALESFFKGHKKVFIQEPSTLIVKHNYDKTRPEKELRDHDNIELNVVIDAIAMNVLPDDSPLKLRHFYLSKQADEDSTEIFIVPNNKFLELIKNFYE